jgi:hypothetical protein
MRQTQAIEHICITAGPDRDYPLLMRDAFNKAAKYFDNINQRFPLIMNSKKRIYFVISHQSSVIGDRSLI